jgi:HTH-type transcriptional regulator/antitoxin HigA
MIKNEKEYKSTKAALAAYQDALANFDVLKSIQQGVAPVIAAAQKASYERQVTELTAQVEAYEKLKAGGVTELVADQISEIGENLIAARIARGLTQREFASRAGLKEQQVQRYEKEAYASANLRRLTYLSAVLDVRFKGELQVSRKEELSDSDFLSSLNPTDFPLGEMNKRGWFDQRLDLRTSTIEERRRCLAAFFSRASVMEPSLALHRKSKGTMSAARRSALFAWQARVLAKARSKAALARRYEPLSPEAVRSLVAMSCDRDGPQKAVDLLLEYGIIVVFERHLPSTKLDGAAMSLDGKYAVIGMTLRHDRIDNFWFVLLHELGHVLRHWGPHLRQGFVDEEGDDLQDKLEAEADEFAQNSIVPEEEWNSSFVRFTKSAESILQFAEKRNIHPALVAGRIRRERSSYKEFYDLLGQRQIKSALKGAGLLE